MEMRTREDGRPYLHDVWLSSAKLREQYTYVELMNATEDVKRRVIDEAIRPDASAPATQTANPTPPAARPAPSAEQVAEAMEAIEQRKRELGLESTRQGERPAVPIGDLEQDIVARWKNEPAICAEFRTLECWAAFRKGIADGTISGYDASGEKLQPTDPVARAIRQADEEDRSAGVDPRWPVEKKAETVWGLNQSVRAEFRERAAYVAWRRRVERSRG